MSCLLMPKCDRHKDDCDDSQQESCMIIFLHRLVHIQPCFGLFGGINMIQHPGGFWRKHIVEIIGDETGGDHYTDNM